MNKNKKIIVTTTINKPTSALLKFAAMDDWSMIVVGDKKTPHEEYERLASKFKGKLMYLSPEYQQSNYPDLSTALGWNTIQRRNIGFIEAYNHGAEIFATVDDDNEPYDEWGKNIYVGTETEVDFYETDNVCFDPVSVTNYKHLWHRGYPVQDLQTRLSNRYVGRKKITPLVQSDFEDGDPDIDAMCRIMYSKPIVKWDVTKPFACNKIAPFNSQNTFFHRKCVKHYSMIHMKGLDTRMDDIWGGYLLQYFMQNYMPFVIFTPPSVYQDRNEHDFVSDLEREMIGYYKTKELLTDTDNYRDILPTASIGCMNLYNKYFD